MSANLGTAWIQVKPSMNGVRGSIISGLKGTGSQVSEQMGAEVGKSRAMTVGMAAVWGAASAVALKAIDTISSSISSSIDGAIRRIDTLNNSSRTFANMGFDAGASAKAVTALEKSIQGLPTPLDSAMRGMTALAATYGDVGLGQKVFTSLNNAILGFGGTTEMVDNALMQLSQLPMDGPLDAQTWNSLRNSGLTPVLVAMAKESGISVSEMKRQFGEGELKVQDFTNRLISMNEKGGGGLKSLEQIAKDSTKGIGTSMSNANTAITRGTAAIINALGSEKIASAITGSGKAMEVALKGIAAGITALPKIIDQTVESLRSMVQFVKDNALAFGAFGISVAAIAAPMAIAAAQALILDVRIRAMLLWDKVIKVVKATAVAFRVLTAAMAANPIGLIVAAVGILIGVFALLWKNNEGFRNFFIGAWEGIKKTFNDVVTSMSKAWTGLVSGFNDAKKSVGEFTNGSMKFLSDTFNNVTTAVKEFVNAGLALIAQKAQEAGKWLEENRVLLTNIGIVIGTILLPTLMKLGVEFVKMAAQAAVSAAGVVKNFIIMAAESTKTAAVSGASAAKSGAIWVVEMAKAAAGAVQSFVIMTAQFIKASAIATVEAIKSGAIWAKQAAVASYAWVTQTLPKIIASFAVASGAAVKSAAISGAAWVAQAAKTTVAWAGVFVKYLAGVATAAAQTLLAGARMAAGWLLAMGPIGLIIAAVAGAVALIIANWDTVKNVVGAVWTWIQQAIANVINWITQNWPLLLGILMGPIGIAIAWIIQNFDKVMAFVGTVWSSIGTGANNAMNWIKGIFGGVAGFFGNIFSAAFNAVTNTWNRIGGFFSGIWSNIANAFSGVTGLGRNIVEGLWNGISNMAGWIQGKIKGFGDGVLKGIKDFFGIKSPSRVMRDQVGEMLGAGIGVGIKRSTKGAVHAALESSQEILAAFNTGSGFNGTVMPSSQLAAANGGGGGPTFYVTNPSPEETAAIIASRMKNQGGV